MIPPDILEKIEKDFSSHAAEVLNIIDESISKAEHLNRPRILRCILFLAGGDITKLKHYVEAASQDPRDVMLWAEYDNHGQEKSPRRNHDFNEPFDTVNNS